MSPNRRALIAAGAALVVGLAVVVGASLSGGDAPVVADRAAPRALATASPSPSVFAAQSPTPVPLTAESFEGKDPFQPLVQATSTPTPGATSTPTPGTTSTPTPGATAVPTSSGQARRVTLVDIFTSDGDQVATVRVDDFEYSVAAGETFADNFKLLSLTSRCGTFVFGDERFTLCIGQEVRK